MCERNLTPPGPPLPRRGGSQTTSYSGRLSPLSWGEGLGVRLIVWAALLLLSTAAHAQNAAPEKPKVTRILFLLDASGSMMAPWEGQPRWNVAKRMLSKMVDSLNSYPNLEVALRVYGHQFPNADKNCEDSRLEVPFAPRNAAAIKRKLAELKAQGNTPITYSLEQSANDFPSDKTSRNVLLLITDGLESCNRDPCAASLALQRKRVFLKPFVIGIGAERDFGKQLAEALDQLKVGTNADY